MKNALLKFGLVFGLAGLLFGADVSYRYSASAQTKTQAPQTGPAASPTPVPTQAPEPTPEDDDEPIKIETELVNVLFTASDSSRRFVTSLKKEDIRVLEDGKPQEIFTFERQVDLPLSLAVVVDTSISQERTLPEEKEAAKSFLEDVVRPAKDEVAILSFTGDTTLEQGLTGNLQRLRRAVDRVEFVPPSGYTGGGVVTDPSRGTGTPPISGRNQRTAGSTAIWDAIWVTSRDVLGESPERTRRAIILITDGYDTSSSKRIADAVSEAQRNEVLIYCIGIGDDIYGGVLEGPLKKLTESTGGRAYFPRSEADLRNAFTQIQIDLRSQYLVAYEPSNPQKDGTFRKITVEAANPALASQKMKFVHRQGYFAKSESAPAKKK
jgi:VWFA-related protein